MAAEAIERPLAYEIAASLERALGEGSSHRAAVCTDLWYLNEPAVRHTPVIAVGGPSRNALAAHFAPHLQRRIGEDGRWLVQTPAQGDDLAVLLWGDRPEDTAIAVQHFVDTLLNHFAAECVALGASS